MAEAIKVDVQGLSSHAAVCDTAAAALSGAAIPAPADHLTQASTAAIAHGNALVRAAAATISGRATATGDKLRAAAREYTTTDGASGQAISSTVQV
ncbi:type VII secretion target [Mycobacteroides abscessus]|uniref:type VII secretion target n=1 Tax=Mycobacteroides abscessus TaxID=36809 RepID=UPI00078D081F|nr:type VII secretion target [Mycobacteroides abscessus]AMU64508.1 hypothetical protein A3O04_03855 [Mycobacteroides abscessus]MBE5406076.1 hypothetical protein [Mycobacteroides abscessus]MBE5429210.1 hypothetical protein [Mycobacteroides abscessus]MBE5498256.1 hypothetical protein [Mycobacteroides abscessus]MBN7424572.1 hypothetical protein [Mycobacteroides abscessus subsp. massiliense]